MVRRAVAEALGTAFLLMAIVGSGIMAERLARGNVALALLANSIATGSAIGGQLGGHLGRRLPASVLRWCIVTVGTGVALGLAVEWH